MRLPHLNNVTIKRKLTMILMLTSISALFLAGIMFIVFSFYVHRRSRADILAIQASVIGRNCQAALKFNIPEDAEKMLSALDADPSIVYACIYDADGQIFATYRSSELDEKDILPYEFSDTGHTFKSGFLQAWQHVIVDGEIIGSAYLQNDQREIYSFMRTEVVVLVLAMLVALVTAYIIASILQRFISRPILQLANTARVVSAKKDYSIRARKETEDEVGLLIESFNEMLSQIQRQRDELQLALRTLEAQKKELESIVFVSSHDLRSPLVNIQGFSNELKFSCENISSVLTKLHIDEQAKKKISTFLNKDIPESLQYICDSVTKMDALLNGLLRLSRLGRASLQMRGLDMNSLVQEVLKNMQYQIKESGVSITINELPSCLGDRQQISQVFTNLLDNSIRYLDPSRKGKIHISGRIQNETSIYGIEDNGIGIDCRYYDKIFEIFHRLDLTGPAGQGLGLTIVRRILDKHNGRIWVESEPGGGSRFYVALPCSAQ
jgi:signal transduction histidine kinase